MVKSLVYTVAVAVLASLVAVNQCSASRYSGLRFWKHRPVDDDIPSLKSLLRLKGGASKAAKKPKAESSKKKSNKKQKQEKLEEPVAQVEELLSEAATPKTAAPAIPSTEVKDIAQAILLRKQKPNVLIADDSVSDDHSIVSLSPSKMEELGLFTADTVLLRGKKRKQTVAAVVSDTNVADSKIRLTKVVRSNLR